MQTIHLFILFALFDDHLAAWASEEVRRRTGRETEMETRTG